MSSLTAPSRVVSSPLPGRVRPTPGSCPRVPPLAKLFCHSLSSISSDFSVVAGKLGNISPGFPASKGGPFPHPRLVSPPPRATPRPAPLRLSPTSLSPGLPQPGPPPTFQGVEGAACRPGPPQPPPPRVKSRGHRRERGVASWSRSSRPGGWGLGRGWGPPGAAWGARPGSCRRGLLTTGVSSLRWTRRPPWSRP